LITGRVRRIVMDGVSSGKPSDRDVARALALAPRTLQRKLQEEGTTFQAVSDAGKTHLLAALRRELARRGHWFVLVDMTVILRPFPSSGRAAGCSRKHHDLAAAGHGDRPPEPASGPPEARPDFPPGRIKQQAGVESPVAAPRIEDIYGNIGGDGVYRCHGNGPEGTPSLSGGRLYRAMSRKGVALRRRDRCRP
jgi:hypothetical protein